MAGLPVHLLLLLKRMKVEGNVIPFPIQSRLYQWKIYTRQGDREFSRFGSVDCNGGYCWDHFVCSMCMTRLPLPDMLVDGRMCLCKYCWSF